MTVLVVDDQPDVVRGILEGVDWKKLHIDRALGAGSAEEAKGFSKPSRWIFCCAILKCRPKTG